MFCCDQAFICCFFGVLLDLTEYFVQSRQVDVVEFSDLLVALQEQKVHDSRDSSVWTQVLHTCTVAHYEWGGLC